MSPNTTCQLLQPKMQGKFYEIKNQTNDWIDLLSRQLSKHYFLALKTHINLYPFPSNCFYLISLIFSLFWFFVRQEKVFEFDIAPFSPPQNTYACKKKLVYIFFHLTDNTKNYQISWRLCFLFNKILCSFFLLFVFLTNMLFSILHMWPTPKTVSLVLGLGRRNWKPHQQILTSSTNCIIIIINTIPSS